MTFNELVLGARDRLVRAGIRAELAGLDAELLAREVLGWDRARFLADKHEKAPDHFAPSYERLVVRRERREPIAYITGVREFWGLSFEVSRDVLIPRHETELILEEAIACLEADPSANPRSGAERAEIIDVGTGCGCLAIALALRFPNARVVATDVSGPALVVAHRNAVRHGVAERVRFVETSFLTGIKSQPYMIVSNPPYVPSVSKPGLVPEVRDFEPGIAIFSGRDGLDGLRMLLDQAALTLAPGGWLIFEFGYGQEDEVSELVAQVPCFTLTRFRTDLQEIPRTAIVKKAV